MLHGFLILNIREIPLSLGELPLVVVIPSEGFCRLALQVGLRRSRPEMEELAVVDASRVLGSATTCSVVLREVLRQKLKIP